MKMRWLRATAHKGWNRLCVVFAMQLLLTQTTFAESGSTEDWEKDWRLPGGVQPRLYHVRLEPRLPQTDFIGNLTLYFTTDAERDSLLLHSKELNISRVTLFSNEPAHLDLNLNPVDSSVRQEVNVTDWFLYRKHEFLVIKLGESLKPGTEYEAKVDFSGSLLTGKLNGFYTSRYTSLKQEKSMATTKFEPNYARLAFPCFDEPALKAAFDIEIVKPSQNETVVSNMPVLKEEIYDADKGSYLVRFERTPVMSTYSLCWILSDFSVVESEVTTSGVLVHGLARRGHEGSLAYATHATKRSVEFFEEYLGVDYGLPKLDIIGVPDFSSGAMENWGVVTFKETNVMINPNTSGYIDYYSVLNVVCHEVAHMWFGNLVTMKWWDDIWLNEGFATYLSMKCTKALQPELIVDEMGYVKKKLSALSTDSLLNSHPIVNPVTQNDQLSGIFDEIAYRKGHSLLEMFEDTLGDVDFRKGLTAYLHKFSFKAAETQDLIAALNEASDRDVSQLMEDWTRQPGYPLLTVENLDSSGLLRISQSRYINKDKQTSKNKGTSSRWDIPIKYRTAQEPTKTKEVYFSKQNDTVVIDRKDSAWYKLNTGAVGFYRVNYPEEMWSEFQNHLMQSDEVLGEWSERANLLDDACSLATSGHLKYDVPLSLMTYFSAGQERHYAPWRVASKCLNDIKKRLPSASNASIMFSEHVRSLVEVPLQKVLPSLNREKSSPFDFEVASEVIFALGCAFKHPQALDKARRLFDLWLSKTGQLNLDIKAVVFRYGTSGEGEEAKWDKLWSMYQEVDDPHELRDLRIALSSFKSSNLIKRLLDNSKNETLVRSQDYYALLTGMAAKKKTNSLVWQIFKSDLKNLESKFSEGKISKLFQIVASNFYTKTKLKEVREFIGIHPKLVPHKSDLKRVEESIANNIRWREKHENSIESWLQTRRDANIKEQGNSSSKTA